MCGGDLTSFIAWGNDDVRQWGAGPHRATHDLASSGLFEDAQLADLLDRMPREAVHAYVMGDDPEQRDTWRRGLIGDATGEQLVTIARDHTLWLNVIGVSRHIPEIAQLIDYLYAEVRAATGDDAPHELKTTMLVSSPTAQVFYHADNQPNALWHIRGTKRVYVYPEGDPFISDEALERIVAGRGDEQLPYNRGLDAGATQIDLRPGEVAWWPQNRPHRVTNVEGLNVSLSVERRTPASTRREKRQAANFFARRTVRRPVFAPAGAGRVGDTASKVLAGAGARLTHETTRELQPSFVVDPAAADGIRSLR